MSVIQRIRDKGAWIVFAIIALALVAFLLQDSSFRRGSFFSNTTTVGKINGESIDRSDFEARMELINQMNNGQITREQLIPSVWNMMVDQKILEQQYKKLGISFTGKELNDLLFGDNPPQWLVQRFTDPATGEFNREASRQEFEQIKKLKNDPRVAQYYEVFIQPTIEQSLKQKYQTLITQAVYIPKWMIEKTNADNNSIAGMSYVQAPYTLIKDDAIKITDEDVNAYVKKHSKEFETTEETRNISYVSFDASASRQDSMQVYEQILTLKQEFIAANDAKTYVGTKGTETPYFDGFVTSSNLKVPYSDTIKSLAIGQVYGPYLDGSTYALAKMVAKRSLPDSVRVRHILVKTAEKGQPVLADSVAKRRIDSIITAINGGADFNTMVQQHSDDAGSKGTKGEYEFASSQFGDLSKEFAEVSFYGNTGDKKLAKAENSFYSGYHYIEVLQQKNMQPAYNIAYLSKAINASQETIGAASTAAQQFAANSRNKKQFEDNVKKIKKTPLAAADIKQNDFSIGALNSSRTLVRWVYENESGDVSEPMEMGDRYVVALITGVNKQGLMSASTARPLVEQFIRNEKKAKEIINAKIKGNTLEAMAQSMGVRVQKADSLSFKSPFIPTVGNEPKIVGAAFNKQLQGKQSLPIAGNTGVFVIRGESIGAKASLDLDIETFRKMTEGNLKSQAGYRAMDALRKAATIKDSRFDFY